VKRIPRSSGRPKYRATKARRSNILDLVVDFYLYFYLGSREFNAMPDARRIARWLLEIQVALPRLPEHLAGVVSDSRMGAGVVG
jgi:hypothetical protein